MKLRAISDLKNKIILGDNLSVLKQIENDTFDLIITSPPYFQQRNYGNGDLGIGNETTESEYLKNGYQVGNFTVLPKILVKKSTYSLAL